MTQPTNEVIKRSINKIYCRYLLNLRKDTDTALIAFFEQNRAQGISATEVVRKLFATRKTLD